MRASRHPRNPVSHFFTGSGKWEQYANNDREIEAIQQLDRHALPGLSYHGAQFVATILSKGTNVEIKEFLDKWAADMQGEGTFVQCFLAMLNSRNPVVEHEPVDLTKLNKSRRKSGKAEFLTYSKTRLSLSRSQARIARARGVDRATAMQTLVRGHFKIRRTGVFWWSPFVRGDARKGSVERQAYDISTEDKEK